MGDTPDSLASGGSQEPNRASDKNSQQDPQQSAIELQSPGKLLAAGRESRELTVEEIGDALNLSAQTVRWLDADDFESLPAAAFTQGYIRNYAKHVGLDPDSVVAAYQEKAGKPAVAWESPRTAAGIAEMVQSHPGVLITAVVAAVVLLIMIVLFLVWPDDGADAEAPDPLAIEEALSERADDRRDAVGAALTDRAADARSGQGLHSASAADNSGTDSAGTARFDAPMSPNDGDSVNSAVRDRDAIDPNDPLAHLPLATTYPADSGSSTNDTIESASTGSTSDAAPVDGNYSLTVNRRLTPAGDDRVRVEVTEDCWISIRSVQGKTLFGLLARPGQTLNLTGEGPFRVKVGYTPGVALFFNDNPVLLEPYTRNQVASLVIGQ